MPLSLQHRLTTSKFFWTLCLHYTVLYSQSPKCQRELVACASELDVHLNRIDRVLSVRWVASSCRTVMAVWRSYAALHEHFVRKSTDPTLGGRERCKFEGLAKKLKSPVFVKNMGLMLDALEELSDLSLALQRADVTLSSATKLISRQVAVFSPRTACESERYCLSNALQWQQTQFLFSPFF